MSEITDPIITFRVRLPLGYFMRAVVWRTRQEMYLNTPEEPQKDYEALFVDHEGRDKCIGTIHFGAHDVSNGTRAHEIRHAVDEWARRAFAERTAAVTEHITNEIDRTLVGLESVSD